MDCEGGTPGWHVRAAIAHLCDKELLVTILPPVIVIDNPVPKVSPLHPPWYLKWTPNLLFLADPFHGSTAISLYNNVNANPDIYEARDHLVAAGGIGNDNLPWHDNDNDGRIENPPVSQIDFYTLNPMEAPLIYEIARTIEEWIEYVFNGADVVNLVQSTYAGILWIVVDKTVPDDWHMHFGVSFILSTTPPPNFLYDLYHTNGASNYVFYSNADYDSWFVGVFNPFRARQAQYIFGKTIATVPIYCTAV